MCWLGLYVINIVDTPSCDWAHIDFCDMLYFAAASGSSTVDEYSQLKKLIITFILCCQLIASAPLWCFIFGVILYNSTQGFIEEGAGVLASLELFLPYLSQAIPMLFLTSVTLSPFNFY